MAGRGRKRSGGKENERDTSCVMFAVHICELVLILLMQERG